jgi:hypothetical protein
MSEAIHEIAALPVEVPRKRSFLRFLWRLFKWCFFTVLFLAGAAIAAVFIFEDDVKDLAIKELNKHLAAEVKVDPHDIDLTIFSTFPNAGIEFKKLIVYEALNKKQRDTIIDAGKISLQFNIMDLFDKKYDIKKILIADVKADFLTDQKGRSNFNFLKESKGNGSVGAEEESMKFQLEEIVFENVTFNYKNKKDFIKVSCKTERTVFNGAFADEKYHVASGGTIFMNELVLYKRPVLNKKNVIFKAGADVNGKNWSLTNTEISINQLNLFAKGRLDKTDSVLTCDLNLSGKNVDVKSALSLLPAAESEKIKDYESEGNFYFETKLKGELSNFEKLNVDVSFGVDNSKIRHIPSDSKLTNVNLTGRYVKQVDGKDELSLKNISASLNSNVIKGNCRLTDLADPFLEMNASVNAELAELIKFYPVDTIQYLAGKVNAEASISGRIKDLKSDYAAQKGSTRGMATIENLAVLFRHSRDSLKIQSGTLEIQQNDLRLKDIALNREENDILLNGELNNFFAWILKENEPLDIKGSAKSNSIKIDKFLGMFGGNGSKDGGQVSKSPATANSSSIKISDKFNLNFDIEVASATWENFKAENVVGKLRVSQGKLFADDLSFKAFDGDVNFTGIADAAADKILFKGSAELIAVDINKMFSQLNNFNQEVIRDKHIKGIATVSLAFSTHWNQKLECEMSSINVSSDLLIERGELVQYKPLEALAKYVDLKELRDIKFSTLRSHVDIRDKTILIGKTEIASTALNLTVSGKHAFNNDIDYHMSILMSELLAKKPGKKKELDEELRYVENDPENSRTIFIRMTGNMDNIKIAYDRKAAKEKIKDDIKKEKQNLKMILKEEFGLFKKDTVLKNPADDRRKKADQKFVVDLTGTKTEEKKKKQDEQDTDF